MSAARWVRWFLAIAIATGVAGVTAWASAAEPKPRPRPRSESEDEPRKEAKGDSDRETAVRGHRRFFKRLTGEELSVDALSGLTEDESDRLKDHLREAAERKQFGYSGETVDKWPDLLFLIIAAPSFDDAECQKWIRLLPKMNREQRADLRQLLASDEKAEEPKPKEEDEPKPAEPKRRVAPGRESLEKARSLLGERKYPEAIEVLDAFIEGNPKEGLAYFFRGFALVQEKQEEKALADYTRAIELAESNDELKGASHSARSFIHARRGEFAKALADRREAVELRPKEASAWNTLAWQLATCPDEKCRDGAEAVKCARKACDLTDWENGMYLDTLAAAYAETGDFANAVKWQKKALEHPDQFPGKELDKCRNRVTLYESQKPFREDERQVGAGSDDSEKPKAKPGPSPKEEDDEDRPRIKPKAAKKPTPGDDEDEKPAPRAKPKTEKKPVDDDDETPAPRPKARPEPKAGPEDKDIFGEEPKR